MDERSPQLPYLTQDLWGCEREEEEIDVYTLETDDLSVTITPQYAGKIWSMFDKQRNKDLLYNNKAHQPANIGEYYYAQPYLQQLIILYICTNYCHYINKCTTIVLHRCIESLGCRRCRIQLVTWHYWSLCIHRNNYIYISSQDRKR